MEFTPESKPPYKKIDENINLSNAIFLFLTQNVISSEYTKNWISHEMALAKAANKPVFVVEDFNNNIHFPVPYLTDYVLYEPTKVEDWTNLQKILRKIKQVAENNKLLSGFTGAGAVLGGLTNQQNIVEGILTGGACGMIFGGIVNALNPPISVNSIKTKCENCGIEFNFYSKFKAFQCPSCRTELEFI